MKGFTLFELLTATAIVAIISAIAYPVFAKAKREGYKATAISNLRQCSISLNMYRDANEHYPGLATARMTVPLDVTYDPGDYWRQSKHDQWPVMLGSFGYADGDQSAVDFITGSGNRGPAPLLVSVFYSYPRIMSFKGDSPPSDANARGFNVAMPTKVLALRTDGSVKFESVPHFNETLGWKQGFTWGSLFFALSFGK